MILAVSLWVVGLGTTIAHARFPSVLDRKFAEATKPMQYDTIELTQVDAKKMANDFVRSLKYHLAKG